MNLYKLLLGLLLFLSVKANLKKPNLNQKLWQFTDYSTAIKVTDFINSEYCTIMDYKRQQSHDYYVGTLPIGKSVYYPSPEFGSDSRIFYLFVTPDGTTLTSEQQLNKNYPIILWLQGGPGCSDWYGQGVEFGTFFAINYTDHDNKVQYCLKDNPYTWGKNYYLLFVDSPIGVGFSPLNGSQVKLPSSVEQSMQNMQNFLDQFFSLQEYSFLKGNPFYVFGESFGGNYVPSLTARLLQKGQLNVQGMGIGDGWSVYPEIQSPAHATYYYTAGVCSTERFKIWKGIQSQMVEDEFNQNYEQASRDLYNFDGSDAKQSFIRVTGNVNMHNFRVYGQDLDKGVNIVNWLNQDKIYQNFNVPPKIKFQMCSQPIYESFYPDTTRNFAHNLTYILTKVRTLVYNGQWDPDVPTNGAITWLNALDWYGARQFRKAQKKQWILNNEVAGYIKGYGNLTFVLVNKAGHLLPHDVPEQALSMVENWINFKM